jgi:hypothetical protein
MVHLRAHVLECEAHQLELPLKAVAFLSTLALAGCATGPDVPYTDRQVAGDSQFYQHLITSQPEVNMVALEYCQGRGKTAVLQSQMRTSEFRMTTSYYCR